AESAPGEEPGAAEARATWFDGWAARVGSLGANLIVAESSEGLYLAFRRLRRDALALGAAFRDSGTLDEAALAALRGKIVVEDR
ncbi:MAG: hypothetical protein HY720_10300, partial [Planctomycetes bacterium]|nr:hypothetical protein [Planctomycetota bacterium]